MTTEAEEFRSYVRQRTRQHIISSESNHSPSRHRQPHREFEVNPPSARVTAQRARRQREREARLRSISAQHESGDAVESGQTDIATDRVAISRIFPRVSQSTGRWAEAHIRHQIARRPYREPFSRYDLGYMNVACSQCGALHWRGEMLTTPRESMLFGMCCNSGAVRLPFLSDPPEVLRQLLISSDSQASEFWENIWRYNRALAFTSIGVKVDFSVNLNRRGPPVFRIQALHLRTPGRSCLSSW
ncbi:hypothetical protein EI94DRAFT_73175 [Lactarius quietus]|nr:hypothetical protein EI94DRAFT_73175 [Lactarius quietus]